jgi:hypothetical protein
VEESASTFRLLLDCGFEIVTKTNTVGVFDATFSVGQNVQSDFMIVQSKGPDRNTDYLAGLGALLLGLANLDATSPI